MVIFSRQTGVVVAKHRLIDPISELGVVTEHTQVNTRRSSAAWPNGCWHVHVDSKGPSKQDKSGPDFLSRIVILLACWRT